MQIGDLKPAAGATTKKLESAVESEVALAKQVVEATKVKMLEVGVELKPDLKAETFHLSVKSQSEDLIIKTSRKFTQQSTLVTLMF